MPNYLHRTTKAYQVSVSTADLPEPVANYIQDPDVTVVAGFATKYWTITGDVVTLMTQGERDAVDAAIAAQQVLDRRAGAVAEPDQSKSFQLRELFEVFNKRDNFLVNRIVELQDALDAMKASVGNAASLRDAIPASFLATNTRTRAETIQNYKDDINAGGAD